MSKEFSIAANWRLRGARLRLEGEECPHCEEKIFPPRDICPNCHGYTLVKKGGNLYQAPKDNIEDLLDTTTVKPSSN